MRRFLAILLAVLIVLMSFATAENLYVLCNPKDYVNVRMTPSTNGIVVGRFDCGDEFETDGEVKRDKKGRLWVHVVNAHLESTDAWLMKFYAQETPITIETATATIVSNARTAVRVNPNGRRRKWAKNGDDFKVLAYSEEWVLTTAGYIAYDCVEVWYE